MYLSDYHRAFIEKEIELHYGQSVKYSRDCDALSFDILEKTGRQVSGTTLKRFYGLVSGQHEPSAFTLDTLAIYTGYDSWSDFTEKINRRDVNLQTENKAQLTDAYSEDNFYTLEALQILHTVPFFYPLHGERRLDAFMQSEKPFHALISEEEYLPNNLAYQIAGRILQQGYQAFHNARLSLMDASSYCFYPENRSNRAIPEHSQILRRLSALHEHIKKHLTNNRGYFIVIVYNLNCHNSGIISDAIHQTMQEFRNFRMFKFMLSCTPDFWIKFTDRHHLNLHHDGLFWYNVRFTHSEKNCQNIPKISQQEMNMHLRNTPANIPLSRLQILMPGFDTLIRIPKILDSFLPYFQKTKQNFNEIDFIFHLLRREVFNDDMAPEKQKILDEVLLLSDYLKKGRELPQEQMETSKQWPNAYTDLLKTFLIATRIQRLQIERYSKIVKIKYGFIAEFINTLSWLRRYGFTEQLVHHMENHYQSNPLLHNNLIIWIAKFALAENHIDFTIGMINRMISHYNLTPELFFIHMHRYSALSSIWASLRNLQPSNNLLPRLSASPHLCMLYLKGFFDLDHLQAVSALHQHCKNTDTPCYDEVCNSFTILYSIFMEKQLPDRSKLLSKIHESPTYFIILANNIMYFTAEPTIRHGMVLHPEKFAGASADHESIIAYFSYCHSLLYSNKSLQLGNYAGQTLEMLRASPARGKSWMTEVLQMMQAYGHLCAGKRQECGRLLDETDLHRFPLNSKVYWSMWYYAIRGRYMTAMRKTEQAEKDFKNALLMAEALTYPLFIRILSAIVTAYKEKAPPPYNEGALL